VRLSLEKNHSCLVFEVKARASTNWGTYYKPLHHINQYHSKKASVLVIVSHIQPFLVFAGKDRADMNNS